MSDYVQSIQHSTPTVRKDSPQVYTTQTITKNVPRLPLTDDCHMTYFKQGRKCMYILEKAVCLGKLVKLR